MAAELFPRARTEIAPGAVHIPDWLDAERQSELLAACREWARPPAGLRTVRTPGGGTMTARQVCLGLHWYPYGYARTVVDGDDELARPDAVPVKWPRLLASQTFVAERLAFESLIRSEPDTESAWIEWACEVDRATRSLLSKLEKRRGSRRSVHYDDAAKFVTTLARTTVFEN